MGSKGVQYTGGDENNPPPVIAVTPGEVWETSDGRFFMAHLIDGKINWIGFDPDLDDEDDYPGVKFENAASNSKVEAQSVDPMLQLRYTELDFEEQRMLINARATALSFAQAYVPPEAGTAALLVNANDILNFLQGQGGTDAPGGDSIMGDGSAEALSGTSEPAS